jgi:hypothetical protein
VNITSASQSVPTPTVVGTSNLFALTDVATATFLSDLYNIPRGLAVKHGSNQSVVEFYHEVCSFYLVHLVCLIKIAVFSSTATRT